MLPHRYRGVDFLGYLVYQKNIDRTINRESFFLKRDIVQPMSVLLNPSHHRILQLSTETGWRGGEQQVFYLLRGLRQLGYDARLAAAPQSELSLRAAKEEIPTTSFSARCDIDPKALLRLIQILWDVQPTIIHAHTGRAHAIAWLARRLAKSRAPLIVSRRVSFSLRDNWFNRLKYKQPDLFLPISQAAAQPLRSLGVPEEKIRVVHEGVDPKRWSKCDAESLRTELGIAPNAFVIGNVAFCDAVKNQAMILDAASEVIKQHPHTVFVIVGDGPDRETLIRRARKLGLEGKAIFPGFRDDLGGFFALFDLFLITSREEGLCTSILDAQMFGTPVIATRVGGIPEIIQDGENGLLIPSDDWRALQIALLELIGDEAKRSQLGARGHGTVRENFTAETMVDRTLKAYREALERSEM